MTSVNVPLCSELSKEKGQATTRSEKIDQKNGWMDRLCHIILST